MNELVGQYWWLFVVALLIGIIVGWWIFAGTRKTRVETSRKTDVLDEGAAPAQRNQALIDSPPASAPVPPATPPPVAPATAEPVAPVEPTPPATPAAHGDDLTKIKGVGPKLNTILKGLGIVSYTEIAQWSDADIDRIDAQLGTFQGRIRRDNWVEQAKLLAAGDDGAFESRFGKL